MRKFLSKQIINSKHQVLVFCLLCCQLYDKLVFRTSVLLEQSCQHLQSLSSKSSKFSKELFWSDIFEFFLFLRLYCYYGSIGLTTSLTLSLLDFFFLFCFICCFSALDLSLAYEYLFWVLVICFFFFAFFGPAFGKNHTCSGVKWTFKIWTEYTRNHLFDHLYLVCQFFHLYLILQFLYMSLVLKLLNLY